MGVVMIAFRGPQEERKVESLAKLLDLYSAPGGGSDAVQRAGVHSHAARGNQGALA